MYVDMYIHTSYFICGKLTFDCTKWPQYEADHWPPSSAKAMNGWRYTSTPMYALEACTGAILLLP